MTTPIGYRRYGSHDYSTKRGTGGLTATLFWDTKLTSICTIEPDGNEIYYAAKNSVAGDGFLDFDNITAYGPENIFFTSVIPDGVYTVKVKYYSGGATPRPRTGRSVLRPVAVPRAFTGQPDLRWRNRRCFLCLRRQLFN